MINITDTTEIKPDGIEVQKYKWLHVNQVLDGTITNIDGININKFNIETLKNYVQNNKFLPCRIEGDKMVF